MWSRTVLISKENNNTPRIKNTRPIAILPSITKAFELSILGNLEKIAYENEHISKNQRGFTPRMNTCINLSNLFDFWFEAKTKKKNLKLKLNSALIFIDLKRAYDNVNRSKLLILLKEASIPVTIIEVIKTMFMKSRITFDGHATCHTSRGLLQGSCLSPILFNFYINSLIKNLEINNTWFRTYADYIVIAANDIKEINSNLEIVLDWWKYYEIELNPSKSGILSILNRTGKAKGITNIAYIHEVMEYKYLGIIINQSINFKGVNLRMKQKTYIYNKQLNKIRRTNLSPYAKKNTSKNNLSSNDFVWMYQYILEKSKILKMT